MRPPRWALVPNVEDREESMIGCVTLGSIAIQRAATRNDGKIPPWSGDRLAETSDKQFLRVDEWKTNDLARVDVACRQLDAKRAPYPIARFVEPDITNAAPESRRLDTHRHAPDRCVAVQYRAAGGWQSVGALESVEHRPLMRTVLLRSSGSCRFIRSVLAVLAVLAVLSELHVSRRTNRARPWLTPMLRVSTSKASRWLDVIFVRLAHIA